MPTQRAEAGRGVPPQMRVTLPLPPPEWYGPRYELTSQGEAVPRVYYVEKGLVKLVHVDRDGRVGILEFARERELVGAQSALLGEGCFESATTVNRCSLAHWRASEFAAHFSREPVFSIEVCRLLCRQVCELRCHVLELGRVTAPERLEALIRRWVRERSGEEGAPGPELELLSQKCD
jgi:CRP-like cAMP-binding protein